MSGIRLCTDSSAQLPRELAASRGIAVVPVSVAIDGSVHDETDLDVERFYARLTNGVRVSTSQPSPARFGEAYARAAERGAGEVLSVHLSEAVSGTVGAAQLAAHDAPLPVTVVDTGTVSFGVAVCVLAAADALATGGSTHSALAAIERVAPTLDNAFVAGRAPAGRVPVNEGLPLLRFADGRAEEIEQAESLGHAGSLISSRILSREEQITVAVGHADAATAAHADALANTLRRAPSVIEVMRYRVGPSVGAHTGAQTYGAFWWPVTHPSRTR